jgi:hypothetical protein
VRLGRAAILVVGAAAIFAAGVGLGRALEENAEEGVTQTGVRTLNPVPLPPAARTTVTVTTTAEP